MLALAASFTAGPTAEATQDHIAFLDACITAAGGPGRGAANTCFGQVMQRCLVATDMSTTELVTCAGEEYTAWTAQLQAALERLAEGEPASRLAEIERAQKLWEPWRDARCAIYTTFEGSLFRPLAARCLADTTADRVVDLWQIERGLVSE